MYFVPTKVKSGYTKVRLRRHTLRTFGSFTLKDNLPDHSAISPFGPGFRGRAGAAATKLPPNIRPHVSERQVIPSVNFTVEVTW